MSHEPALWMNAWGRVKRTFARLLRENMDGLEGVKDQACCTNTERSTKTKTHIGTDDNHGAVGKGTIAGRYRYYS